MGEGRRRGETCAVRVDASVLDNFTSSTLESDREPTRPGPSDRDGFKTLWGHVNEFGQLPEEICTCHVAHNVGVSLVSYEHTLVRHDRQRLDVGDQGAGDSPLLWGSYTTVNE